MPHSVDHSFKQGWVFSRLGKQTCVHRSSTISTQDPGRYEIASVIQPSVLFGTYRVTITYCCSIVELCSCFGLDVDLSVNCAGTPLVTNVGLLRSILSLWRPLFGWCQEVSRHRFGMTPLLRSDTSAAQNVLAPRHLCATTTASMNVPVWDVSRSIFAPLPKVEFVFLYPEIGWEHRTLAVRRLM